MKGGDHRGANEEIFTAIAPSWERRRAEIEEICAPVRHWLIRELAPRRGDTVLELAAGVGDTGFEVARVVGEEGGVISSDLSPAMVDAARRRGAELGIANVDYRVLDAENMALGADSVDGVVCRFGYMLMPNPAAALSESRRVLRPGGRLTLAVFGAPHQNPFFATIASKLVQGGHIPQPDPAGPGIFAMASEEHARALLVRAGFGEVRTEEVPMRFPFGDVHEYVSFVADTAGPIAMALRRLPERARERMVPELEEAFAPHATGPGYELPGMSLVAVAS